MKILYATLLISTLCYSQKENNIWYFGNHAGLDFNSGSPVTLNNSAMNSPEPCASIADSGGNLLFYTDGMSVWNRNHVLMPNGTGLNGHISVTQGSLIMKKPGSADLYYIFTNMGIYQFSGPYGLQYSEVDMTLDGGNGAVTVKNVPLVNHTNEKLSSVMKNSTDFWVVTHQINSDVFYAYEVTVAGVNPVAVTTAIGDTILSTGGQYSGQQKISPDGSKLVACNGSGTLELYDFDVATGVLSNRLVLFSGEEKYGVEFSPSGKMLYATIGGARKLVQFNLTAADIPSSMVLLYYYEGLDSYFVTGMQLATDGKIYIGSLQNNKVSVIHNPEIEGIACNFEINAIDLETGISVSGLPAFCATPFYKPYNPEEPVATFNEIPKGISPNGDLLNDTFNLTGLNVKHLSVYNRYGLEVFSKDNYTDEWHGQTDNGNTLPTGTYYYVVKTDQTTKTGWVYLNDN